jgi:hypothetical protein
LRNKERGEPVRGPSARDGRRSSSDSSEVDRIVRLHHRRRGWAWVAVGSLIGVVVYAVAGAHLFDNLTGTTELLSVIPVFVLLALMLAGLVVAIVDTVQLRRADTAVQATARANVSHYPLRAHATRYPPRHHGSWVFGILMLAAFAAIAVAILPEQVDSVAYLAGAESQNTFNPVSYGQSCGRGGCHPVTEGYLSESGAHVTWDGPVPLGQPFTVRTPLWAWGTGRNLMYGDGTPIAVIIVGLFFEALTVLFVFVLIAIVRHSSSRRRQTMITSAPAARPGTGRAHHPDLP